MKEKKLGLPTALAAGIGLIVATSCLVTLSQGVGIGGKGFIIAMGIACGLNILVAFSFAEMNSLMPISGGLGQYTMAAMGPFVAMIAVIGGYLFTNIFAASSEAAMIGIVVSSTILPSINPLIITMFVLLGLFLVNFFGIRSYARIQIVVTGFMIGSLILLAIIGFVRGGSGEIVQQATTDFNPMGMGIVTLTALAFWLFVGAEFVTPLTKDIKNPERNIPLGMILSLLILMVVQGVMVFGISNYVPYDILATSNQPHMDFATSMLGTIGTNWMMIISIGAVISTLNTVLASIPRMLMGLADGGMLPSIFAEKNKHGVPYLSLILVFACISFILMSGITTADDLVRFILTGAVFWMVAYIIAHINVLILRKKYPDKKPSFRIKLFGLPQIIGIIGMVYMIMNIIDDPVMKSQIYQTALILFAVLIVYSVIWIKKVMKKGLFETITIEEVIRNEELSNRNDGEDLEIDLNYELDSVKDFA
ncbi:MAG: APC family permease [Halanaerobiaceae bacterium]